jgi:MarR family 2-MHQ and catechol resistance regulon transcriptional repressor
VYIKLMRVSDTLTSKTSRFLKDSGLTGTQFGVMETLMHLGPLQQRIISEKLLKSDGNITLVIDNLERQQLIRREVNPEDRRCIKVHLTDKGHTLIAGIFPAFAAYVAESMSVLPAEEQRQLGELCRQLGRSMAEHTT